MNPQRYPLQWPAGRARTPGSQRRYGRFGTRSLRAGRSYATSEGVTISQAVDRLQEALDRLGARDALISSNLELRLDGMPRGGQSQPSDPGVCVYFKLKGKPHALPCDVYTRVEQNIAAIAAHIEATRAIERHGVADLGAMFQFAALPPPGNDTAPGWRTVFGYEEGDRPTLEQAETAYRRLASSAHPDRGGSAARMAQINEARDQARKELAR